MPARRQSAMHPSPPTDPAADAARAWRASLPPHHRARSVAHGVALFGLSAVLYLALFAGALLLPSRWLNAVCLIVLPLVIGSLFILGHDAAHNTLTQLGWLNRVLGRLALLPAWHPYTAWCHAHNTLHHGGTNLKGRHPDFPPFSKDEFDRLPRWRRWLEVVYRTPAGIGLFYTLDFYLRYLILPRGDRYPPFRRAFRLDRLLVLAFVIAQFVAAYLLAGHTPDPLLPPAGIATAAVLLPWSIWIWFMGFITFLQHTHPRAAWYDDEREWSFYHVQLRSTTHVLFPWPIGALLHNIMDHPAHHIDPTIPLYELPASQRRLEEQAPSHSLIVPWSLGEYLRICRTCKLYDYRQHRWLDFTGRPTTPPGLHAPPAPPPPAAATDAVPSSGSGARGTTPPSP